MPGLLLVVGIRIGPTHWQMLPVAIGLMLLASACAIVWLAFAGQSRRVGPLPRAATVLAVLLDLGVVLYRNLLWRWACPVQDNFDSVLLFVVMLGGLMFYLGRRPRRATPGPIATGRAHAADLVLLPLMTAMQAVAALVYFGGFRQFPFAGAWPNIHLGTMLLAMLPLTAAAAAGAMFILLDRALRRKNSVRVLGTMPSLERLDRMMRRASVASFVLLTVSIFAGVLVLWQSPDAGQAGRIVKFIMAALAWLVCLALISVRLAPRLRGRTTAWLCMLALALVLGGYVAAYFQAD